MQFLNLHIPFTGIKGHTRFAFLFGFCVSFILIVFEPFGTDGFQHPYKFCLLGGYGLVIALFYSLTHWVAKWLSPKFYQAEDWKFWKELLLVLLGLLVSMTATYFYFLLVIGGGRFSVSGYFSFLSIAAATAFIPILILVLVKMQDAKNYFENLKKENSSEEATAILSLTGNNKNEQVRFAKAELLYLKSSDNYVEIHLWKGEKVVKHIIRSTLSQIVKTLEDDDILKVHRSYVVNFQHASVLDSKGSSHHLKLNVDKLQIPVSRTQVAAVRTKLQERIL